MDKDVEETVKKLEKRFLKLTEQCEKNETRRTVVSLSPVEVVTILFALGDFARNNKIEL